MSEKSAPGTLWGASSQGALALQCLLLGALTLAGATVGIEWARQADNISALWPPNAILLAFVLNAKVRARNLFFLISFAANITVNLIYGGAAATAVGYAGANLLEVTAAYLLIKRFAQVRDVYSDAGSYFRFMLHAVLLAPAAGATLGATIVSLEFGAAFASVWVTWWLADALGMVIFFPLASLVVSGRLRRHFRVIEIAETLLTLLAVCAVAWFALQQSVLIVFVVIQAILVWIIFRSGRTGCAIAVTCTGVLLTALTLQGLGPIGTSQDLSTAQKVLDLQALLAMLSVPMMMIAVILGAERENRATIAQKEERYRRLYDESPVMLHSTDEEGRLVSVSEFWLKKMGYRREEVLGRKSVEFLTEESRRYALDDIIPHFLRDGEVRNVEYQFIRKNGEVFDALLSAIQEPAGSDDIARSLAVITDISKLKRAESELGETVVDLERSNRDLEQFAYLASHDLQEPLRMVASFTELLEQEYGPQLDDRAREFIHFARDGASRMSRMVSDILAYSRVTRDGDMNERADLNVAADVAVVALKHSIDDTGAIVIVEDLPEVTGSFQQLSSLLQNLIGNAIKYRGSEAPVIRVSALNVGQEWQITVADNGIGIEPKHYGRIFDLFKRLHRRDQYEGTGIGLSVCRKIVEAHGGRIWVESELGKGSSFHFTLALKKSHQEAAE